MPAFLTEAQVPSWLSGEVGVEVLKPVPNDYIQRWPVSKRVNSSKAGADEARPIEPTLLTPAQYRCIKTVCNRRPNASRPHQAKRQSNPS
jgi:hypothetical protein